MELSVVIAGLSMLIAAVVGFVTLIRYLNERRTEKRELREQATKAKAERDSIAVKGAENALLVMERMLKLSSESEEKLRCKVIELESTVEDLKETINKKSRRIAELETIIDDMERRLSYVERGET